ncbi:MAG: lycopene cyclase domain-containing protein [Chloroflexota bacterium]|nr:lycopene cyclase domain-containing protein [Chloroflexota bacterium]
MTYFGFLIRFLGPPLLILLGLAVWDDQRGRAMPATLRSWPVRFVILAHVIVAVLYTTPWDNYLVANGVWWYNPALVTGFVLGWVPIEEYTFFVLQTIMTGLWVTFLAKRLALPGASFPQAMATRIRWITTALLCGLWLSSAALLFWGWQQGTYLALILVWALPPIILQASFAGDILWHYRKLLFAALLPATLYLALGDALAIRSGTWTIDPAQSTQLFFGGLPLEEFVFFLITNTLVVLGMILVLANESQQRAPQPLLHFLQRVTTVHKTPSSLTIDN